VRDRTGSPPASGQPRRQSGKGRRAYVATFQQQSGSRSDGRPSAAAPVPKSWWCRPTFARRGLQERSRRLLRHGAVSTCHQQCRHTKHVPHQDLDGLTAEDFQRIYAVNTIGPFQMIRAARAQLEAGAKASGAAVRRGQRVVGGRYFRRRLVGRLCRKQGALNTITPIAGARAGALDPVNTVCPRLYRYALVHQGPRRGRRQGGA